MLQRFVLKKNPTLLPKRDLQKCNLTPLECLTQLMDDALHLSQIFYYLNKEQALGNRLLYSQD